MERYCQNTLDYYNSHADSFREDTIHASMSALQEEFLEMLPAGGRILDLGCGPGRDTRLFLERGFRVTAVDGSEELCRLAEDFTGQPVICSTFQEFRPGESYDGIWACASLLHLPKEEIVLVIERLSPYLREGGVFYMSFKYGSFSGERNGRFFTDLTEQDMDGILAGIPALGLVRYALTGDVRSGRGHEKWLNVYLEKRTVRDPENDGL